MERGKATIEFYQNLKAIKEAYNNGYIVYKHLYDFIKAKQNLKMSYRSFINYAKKEFDSNSNKKEVGKKSSQVENVSNKSEVIEGELIEPINDTSSLDKEEFDDDTLASMEEYMKNMSHIFETRKSKKQKE